MRFIKFISIILATVLMIAGLFMAGIVFPKTAVWLMYAFSSVLIGSICLGLILGLLRELLK